jgi:hypothetical protein
MDPKFILLPLAGLAAGYLVGRLFKHIRARVNAAPVDLNHLDDVADLDFATPCNVGPEGVFAREFEQCPRPATWDVDVHHCKGDGNQNSTIPVVLCDHHLALIAEALTGFIDEHNGVLPCGLHADNVFDMIRAKRI